MGYRDPAQSTRSVWQTQIHSALQTSQSYKVNLIKPTNNSHQEQGTHPCQHLLAPEVLILAILIGGISRAFPWWQRTSNISLSASQPFEIPLLWILCLVLYPIFWLGCLIFLEVSFLFFFFFFFLDTSLLLDVGWVKIFFPICRLLICPVEYDSCLTEAFQFHEIPFITCWS